ncbi:hypothetical protein [Chitinophaga vietnamensis]|uniref:hypothetical protein n=1 Tax=Chitinophaga vietnamensis TaxID=2593957 RepID=UPI001177B980|nr:hypothetical protein [Chitinophaga vietnamensis]
MTRRFRRIVVILSIALFLLSLFQPSFYTNGAAAWGLSPFLTGWLGVFVCGAGISWLANPALLAAWIIFFRKKTAGLICGGLAAIFAASFLLFPTIMVDEAGNMRPIEGYGAGYWLWLGSCAVMFAAGLYDWIITKKQ